MTPEKLIDAANTLGWIVDQLNRLPEERDKAALESLMCIGAQNFCLDFERCMSRHPDDPYAALVDAITNGTEFTDSQKSLAKILLRAPKDGE